MAARPSNRSIAPGSGSSTRAGKRNSSANSQPAGTTAALPIIALRSPVSGPAIWILAGIHGEEPAGPNAIASAIDDIARLGAKRPVVLLPLLNPQGYARNWRYLNVAVYSESIDGQSVGDSSHLLPSRGGPGPAARSGRLEPRGRCDHGVHSPAAEGLSGALSIDLHEDNLIDEGYVYSQGKEGEKDALAIDAVGVLRENGVPIRMSGKTRFDEPIAGGIVGPVVDSSIDELMSAPRVLADGQRGSRARRADGARIRDTGRGAAARAPHRRARCAHPAARRRASTPIAPDPDTSR